MNLKRHIKDLSIFSKITVITIITIILSSTIFSSFQLLYFTDNMKNQNKLLIQEAAERIESFVLGKYNMTYNQRTLLHSNDYVVQTIKETRDTPASIYRPEPLTQITNYLSALCYSDNTIKDAILFTADGQNAFSHSNEIGRTIYLSYDYNSIPYIQKFYNSQDTITTIYDDNPPYLTLSTKSDPGVITFLGKLYDPEHPTKQIVLGYLLINFSTDSIDAVYKEINAASDGIHMVVNSDSKIIYCSDPSYIGTTYTENTLNADDIFFRKSISLSGLQIISAVSDEVLLHNLSHIIWKTIYIIGASILCLVIITTILHKYYKKRFNTLETAMFQISQGDFNTRLTIHSYDEIGKLSDCFNTMCETLNTYIKKTYLAETQQRTAELYALQAQINPHFLTNTIESIRMRALTDDNYELAQMLANLGNLFRWMVQFHQDIVYLDDEIEYINSYIELQTFRFEDKLDIQIDVPTDILLLGFPKFTIQPIVENSLTHGFVAVEQALQIYICLEVKEEVLYLKVVDNGIGIEPQNLQKLQQHISGQNPDPAFGVALQNVHKRIQLLFGEAYGLHIDSTYGKGTEITVTLPALPQKEMEKYVQNNHR